MKITHLLSIWLKYTVNWTRNSDSAWLGKWLLSFTDSCTCFRSGYFHRACADLNHVLHTVFLFPVRWKWGVGGAHPLAGMCAHVWVYVREAETETKKRETEAESFPEWVFELFSRDLCHCPIVLCFFNHFLLLWMAVSFLLLLLSHKKNTGTSDKVMKPEEFLEENILMCFIELSHFVFFIKGLNSTSYEAPTNTVFFKKNT